MSVLRAWHIKARFAQLRGFIGAGAKAKLNCRLIERTAFRLGGEAVELRRLFLTEGLYSRNIQKILELRLAQIPGGDPELRRLIGRVIRELGYGARDSLGSVRLVASRALDMIWAVELDGGEIPEAWKQEWKFAGRLGAYDLKNFDRFPRGDPGRQCKLLCEIVGGINGRLPVVAKHLTRPSYVLFELVKGSGDLGQHLKGEVTLSYAAAIGYGASPGKWKRRLSPSSTSASSTLRLFRSPR
ncbi:MAG: hypothetical protein AAF657_25245 [Acidobacteriota bacterium]